KLNIYSKVWVVNKTGVALMYRAPYASKESTEAQAANSTRSLDAAYYTKDGDSLSFFGRDEQSVPMPVMLSCNAKSLQFLPYNMAAEAESDLLYLYDMKVNNTSGKLYRCNSYYPSKVKEMGSTSVIALGSNDDEYDVE
ncbi:unnamed protein product, partial [Chrysoparadoxa australica]